MGKEFEEDRRTPSPEKRIAESICCELKSNAEVLLNWRNDNGSADEGSDSDPSGDNIDAKDVIRLISPKKKAARNDTPSSTSSALPREESQADITVADATFISELAPGQKPIMVEPAEDELRKSRNASASPSISKARTLVNKLAGRGEPQLPGRDSNVTYVLEEPPEDFLRTQTLEENNPAATHTIDSNKIGRSISQQRKPRYIENRTPAEPTRVNLRPRNASSKGKALAVPRRKPHKRQDQENWKVTDAFFVQHSALSQGRMKKGLLMRGGDPVKATVAAVMAGRLLNAQRKLQGKYTVCASSRSPLNAHMGEILRKNGLYMYL